MAGGGRGFGLEHGGSFRRLDHAKERERLIGGWLALGLNPKDELAKLTTETEPRMISTVARAWLESRIDLAPNTQRVYQTYIESIEQSSLGQIDVATLTPRDVRTLVEDWNEKGYASKTIRGRVSALRQIIDFAEIDPNPARHRTVKLPPREEQDIDPPIGEIVVATISGIAEKYRLPIVLMEQTALRGHEAVSLSRDDIDAPSLRLRVKASNTKGRRGSRRSRWVPVPAWLMEILVQSLPLSGELFPDVTADGLRSALSDVCKRMSLKHYAPHQLRHRRISLWHFHGVPAREIAARAGHSRASMSLDVYTHVIVPDELDPELLKASLTAPVAAPNDAPVMHG